METRNAAQQYGVTGWVRNKSDGGVEAVFEGDAENVHTIIEWCKQGPSNARVDHVDIQWEDAVGEFNDFEITY
jgi:acylphosphatase